MYDYVWLFMTMYDHFWLCMTMFDYVRHLNLFHLIQMFSHISYFQQTSTLFTFVEMTHLYTNLMLVIISKPCQHLSSQFSYPEFRAPYLRKVLIVVSHFRGSKMQTLENLKGVIVSWPLVTRIWSTLSYCLWEDKGVSREFKYFSRKFV